MKKIFLISTVLFFALSSAAQNLNPTVDVTNDFNTSFTGIAKENLDMNIPDSLLQFNRNFDYFTFDNPYRGSYEFVPYSVELRPEPGDYDVRQLWLVAGAGYALRPVLNAVYTPKMKQGSPFKVNVFQNGSAYIGDYVRSPKGFRVSEKIGADCLASFKKVNLGAEILYQGGFNSFGNIAVYERNEAQDYRVDMHSGAARFVLNSVNSKYVDYSVVAKYRYALFPGRRAEHFVDAKGTVAPKMGERFSLPIDIFVQTNGNLNTGVTPHLGYTSGPFSVNVGAQFAYFNYSSSQTSFDRHNFSVRPDIDMNLDIARGVVSFYLAAKGGKQIHSAADMYLYNPYFVGVTDAYTDETLNAYAGFRGRITHSFQYDVKVGYDFIAATPLIHHRYMGATNAAGNGFSYLYAAHSKFNLFYVNAKFLYKSECFDLDANFNFNRTFFPESSGEKVAFAYDLPMITGDIRARYNYNRRIYAGIFAGGATSRDCGLIKIKGYVNLGVSFEYRFGRHFGVWIQGHNLLNQEINIIPGYAEKGIGATAGITLNL